MKPKAIYFYTYLPPWRVDVFNEMGKYYELTIIFLNSNSEGFTYNRSLLTSKLDVEYVFWNKGFKIGSKPFRFGIKGLIEKYKPEVIFSHEYSPTSILLALFIKFKLFEYKLIVTTSDNVAIANSVKGVKTIARKFILNYSYGMVVYSESIKNWYKNHFPNIKIEICPNIQNPKSLFIHKNLTSNSILRYRNENNLINSNIILFVGRLVEAKGLDLLLNAFAASNNEDYKLIIVGEGKEKNILKNLSLELKISEKVFFPGYFDSSELYQWYSLANFFILPSRYEPFGAVVNEALILGCPVIASKFIGALEFIKPGFNGLIFDPLNKEEFIDVLNEAMDKFKKINITKESLMIGSFEEYVTNFYLISK
jgi:glycosyltransferase involved in cell wall biosynthesis